MASQSVIIQTSQKLVKLRKRTTTRQTARPNNDFKELGSPKKKKKKETVDIYWVNYIGNIIEQYIVLLFFLFLSLLNILKRKVNKWRYYIIKQ